MKLKIPYWPILFGSMIAFAIGFGLNALVMAVNQNQMPVFIPNGCQPIADMIHSCMTPGTHLKFLADWIVLTDDLVASPGDLLVWFSEKSWYVTQIIWACLVIRDYSKNSV